LSMQNRSPLLLSRADERTTGCSVLVDGTLIREFKNHADRGVAYPSTQRMRLYGSLWDAEDWATQGGRVKTDWASAPFVAAYRRYNVSATACVWDEGEGRARCPPAASWMARRMDWWSWMTLSWVRMNYMVYDYCVDRRRFPHGAPPECDIPIGRS